MSMETFQNMSLIEACHLARFPLVPNLMFITRLQSCEVASLMQGCCLCFLVSDGYITNQKI